jgi:hypothetical protein
MKRHNSQVVKSCVSFGATAPLKSLVAYTIAQVYDENIFPRNADL